MGKIDKHLSSRPERSPERARLAELIERRDDFAATAAALKAAIPRADDQVFAARRALEAAEDGVPAAKAAAAAHLVALAVGEAGDAPPTVEAARRATALAEDGLDVAKVARDTLRQRLTETEFSLSMAKSKAEDAARVVLSQSPAVAALVAEVTELQRSLVDKGAALEWVFNKRLVPTDILPEPTGMSVPTVIGRLNAPTHTWRELTHDRTIPGAAPWQAALAALMNDADAPLLY